MLSMYGPIERSLWAKQLTITCRVINAEFMDDEVQFYLNDTLVASLYQKYDKCTVSTKPVFKNYQVMCGNGTQYEVSNIKLYTLTVKKLFWNELLPWRCHTRIVKFDSETFNIRLKSKILDIPI